MSCCGKVICGGCVFADFKQNHRQICPFCRTPVAENMTDVIQRHNKWLEVNDPYAFFDIGTRYFQGLGVVQDKSKALEYYLRGVELGSADCLAIVGFMYDEGDGVVKDKKKAIHYYELAAIQGHSTSRYSLGFNEYNFGKYDRALKHWLISCRHGSVKSLEAMKTLFIEGHANEKALRSYQEYIKEIKICQRDEAAAFSEEFKYILDS
jgi:TPR repeat protein